MATFDKVLNRRNTKSAKWDLVKKLYGSDDVIPMWVADMDFPVPSAVTEALSERVSHQVYGYTLTDSNVDEAILHWVQSRHQWNIKKDWLLYSPGVITTLHIAVQAFTDHGDSLLIQTPVYPPFYDLVNLHDRTLLTNPLELKDGKYEINFEHLETQFKKGVKAFILSNPHNPVGRVWTKEELTRIAELCIQYDVLILSDEIHADLIHRPNTHIPIASLGEEVAHRTVTCMSPTKTFNMAGLRISFAVISDKEKKLLLKKHFKKQGLGILNTMGILALEAAYQHGKPWLEELLDVLETNIYLVKEAFSSRKEITLIEPEGTYLLWLDCRAMGLDQKELKQFMQEEAKVGLNDGVTFGDEGEGFMRINVACPTETLQIGLKRIVDALDKKL
ncbi:pyridoxal phosphate-dependent aminotransferase [Radiobacillus kanasensis]|uniref:MalY/PatB family protein n=1 Tax=Radiobacillus kanasensis TaxID=2844358 RepID=UPI001E482FA0|nr:MalY/PatB family protein [Radiobacillus kanasensis]UFT98201.1 pyridoxal phosphate-dependent aminotransferase [Radiobacillus kanasensis]